jgi:tetratricopeptide (TPR) repeat protein
MPRWFVILLSAALSATAAVATAQLDQARDRQDAAALDGLIAQAAQRAQANPNSVQAQYEDALANSYGAELAIEVRNKSKAQSLAETGIDAARKAVTMDGNNAEYHRLLGELCGQAIPANIMLAFKYGQCARDEVNKAIQIDPKLAIAYVSRGVGNYYLPAPMGGGYDLALKDFDKAIALNPNLAEAYLWKGLALRKQNKNADARQALDKALQLDPQRLWAKQQLDKTPAQ